MLQKLSLKYGSEEITFTYEGERLQPLLPSRREHPLSDEEILHALKHPINSPPLKEIVRPGQKVVIAVSDITRSTAMDRILPFVIQELKERHVPNGRMRFIFAVGNHRPVLPEEAKAILGKEIYNNFDTLNHRSTDDQGLVNLGKTAFDTEVSINKEAMESDRVILTGGVGFHYFAGFTGGRKSITPGLSSYGYICHNHLLSIDFEKGCFAKGVAPASLDSNPVHNDMMEACAMVDPDFIVNSVVNEHQEVVGLFAGHWRDAHLQATRFYSRSHLVPIAEKRELVIASCGGFPKDINFIQAHKTIQHASRCLQEGGTMIVLAECGGGMGNQDLINWFPIHSTQQLLTRLKNAFHLNGQTAFALHTITSRFRVIFISSLKPSIIKLLGLTPASSVTEAVEMLDRKLRSKKGYLIPQGAETLPCIQDRQ
ncbi:hypothetical protein CEE39_05835 [bacterium (candidate division B38) B3_B38]|nr:MAG: hypothetical protein CEE39_05835 [bacterium (candidate division B38) B3_B38]